MGKQNTNRTSLVTKRANKKEMKDRQCRQLAYFIEDLMKDEQAANALLKRMCEHEPRVDKTPGEKGDKGKQT